MSNELTVDNQQMFLLSDDEWDTALRDGVWEDLLLFYPPTKPLIEAMLRFTRAHGDAFRLALFRDGPYIKTWAVIHLLATRYGWQRVFVERVQCDACGAKLMIANPTVADLYFGVENWAELMKRATASGSLRCIQCGEKLPRFAIWVEALKDE
ncbi:MAG TPA: hypothetical protein VGP73_02330 [Thermoanaerobaculia bacterium]